MCAHVNKSNNVSLHNFHTSPSIPFQNFSFTSQEQPVLPSATFKTLNNILISLSLNFNIPKNID